MPPAFIWTFGKYPPAFNRDPAFIRILYKWQILVPVSRRN